MSPLAPGEISLADVVAAAVGHAFRVEFANQPVALPEAASSAPRKVGRPRAATPEPAAAPQVATPAVPASPRPATAKASTDDLVDRVRAELAAAYDGRPVTPDRLAFRLQSDRDLIDAALTYLVTRREARPMGGRGKIAYVPLRR